MVVDIHESAVEITGKIILYFSLNVNVTIRTLKIGERIFEENDVNIAEQNVIAQLQAVDDGQGLHVNLVDELDRVIVGTLIRIIIGGHRQQNRGNVQILALLRTRMSPLWLFIPYTRHNPT